ncbi:MAG: hypothetical protein AAF483_17065 [Planctomycetota bacterium]
MASSTKRTRSERVASLKLESSNLSSRLRELLQGSALLRFALALATASLLVLILQGWKPPFSYREGQIPKRDIIAKVAFEVADPNKTEAEREQARSKALCHYKNDPKSILSLVGGLQNAFATLDGESTLVELSAKQKLILNDFLQSSQQSDQKEPIVALERIRSFVDEHGNLEGGKVEAALNAILLPIADSGILTELGHKSDQGDQNLIQIDGVSVGVAKVRRTEILANLPEQVSAEFQKAFKDSDDQIVAQLVSNYLSLKLPASTLSYLQDPSEEARRMEEEAVEEAVVAYYPAVSKIAEAGKPLTLK